MLPKNLDIKLVYFREAKVGDVLDGMYKIIKDRSVSSSQNGRISHPPPLRLKVWSMGNIDKLLKIKTKDCEHSGGKVWSTERFLRYDNCSLSFSKNNPFRIYTL